MGEIYLPNANQAEDIKTAVEGIQGILESADYATETKLEAVRSILNSLNNKDFATTAKQDAIKTVLDNIKAKTDNIPSDPTKESGKLTSIDTAISAIKSTDGIKKIVDTVAISAVGLPLPSGSATETKQDSVIGLIGEKTSSPTANTLLARIKSLEDKTAGLISGVGEAQATPTANTVLARLKSLEDKIDDILSGDTPVPTQLTGSIPAYNWFKNETRPTPIEDTKPAIGVEVDAETGDMVGLLWTGEDWEEV